MTTPRNGTLADAARTRCRQTWNGILGRAGRRGMVRAASGVWRLACRLRQASALHWLLWISALCLVPAHLLAWTNGELSMWLDNDRGHALEPIIKKFESDYGIRIKIEAPEQITDSFAMAAQVAKGPDIVIWAHDKVGEWADAGLIAPIEVHSELLNKFLPKGWEAVSHRGSYWGYPIALETVSLIYNKALLDGPPPAQLSGLVPLNEMFKKKHPEATTILWDYKSPYYSWGILASGGGYVFGRTGRDFDLQDVGVAVPGAIDALTEIIRLVQAGVLPKSVSYSAVQELMARGKLAMMISGPWAWSDLIKSGIDFGLAPIPGVGGAPGRPFIGVSVAYLNRSSPNHDLAKDFLERYLLTEEGLTVMDHRKPLGIPALVSLQEKMVKDNPHLQQLKGCLDAGQVMPNVPQMGRFFSALGSALQIATAGKTSPEAALREAEATMRHK